MHLERYIYSQGTMNGRKQIETIKGYAEDFVLDAVGFDEKLCYSLKETALMEKIMFFQHRLMFQPKLSPR